MESHKPLLSNNELKTLCRQVTKENSTPLKQAQAAIKVISKLRQTTRNTEISAMEWQCMPENKNYIIIAEDYLSRKAALKKKRKEEKDKFKNLN